MSSTTERDDTRSILIATLLVLAVRVLTLPLYPLTDSTEARYALIARSMADMGDWITPWFAPGLPFWGKPPLAFWAGAGMIELFGFHEWSSRFATFFPAALTVALCGWWALRRNPDRPQVAALSMLILSSSIIFFISSGSVLTDTWLMLGTSMATIGFDRELQPQQRCRTTWLLGWSGILIALLSKGPLGLALIGPPLLFIAWRRGELGTIFLGPRFWLGLIVSIGAAAPWYILAEIRTPGFLQYFLIGEHWFRFTMPRWNGDLYGTLHSEPYGMIWVFLIVGWLPWSLLLPWAIRDWWTNNERGTSIDLLAWGLWPVLLFTATASIIPTYILPGSPAIALWLARHVTWQRSVGRLVMGGVMPVAVLIGITLVALDHVQLKTTYQVIRAWNGVGGYARTGPIYWASPNAFPFSARLYAGEGAIHLLPPGTVLRAGSLIITETALVPMLGLVQTATGRYKLWRCDAPECPPHP